MRGLYRIHFLEQIISPHDKGISKCIMDNLVPWESSWDEDLHKTSSLCIDPLFEVHESYMKDIQQHCHFRFGVLFYVNHSNHSRF